MDPNFPLHLWCRIMPQCHHPNHGGRTKWFASNGSYWPFSDYIKPGIQLHNCVLYLWHKWNYCTPYEKPLCFRTHQSLQWDFWLLGKTGTTPGRPQYGQWMSTRTEGHHCSSKHKKLELLPPHYHCTNPAEKCIDTFKCHVISGLSAMDPNFPLHLWCRIILQCQDTLNMLRTYRHHPHM